VQLREDLLNGDQINITTPAGPPSIQPWYGILKGPHRSQCSRGYHLEWRPAGLGRPQGTDTSPTLTEMEKVLQELKPLSISGAKFSAEDVFKHFVCPVPPYHDRVMNMSPEAYLQELIDQKLIKDEHDQHVQLVQAVTNPWVRVHGRFKSKGKFVIHLVESMLQPQKVPPQDWPIKTIAILKEGMYYLQGFEHMRGKIDFAGERSESWVQRKWDGSTVWRVTFGRRRGRPNRTRTYTREELLLAMGKVIPDLKTREPYKRVSKTEVAKMINTSYRQLQAWLVEYNIDFDDFCLSVTPPENYSTS
jgi:hypothetical protein